MLVLGCFPLFWLCLHFGQMWEASAGCLCTWYWRLDLGMLKILQKSFGLAWMVILQLCMCSVCSGCSFAVATRMVVSCDSVEREQEVKRFTMGTVF